MLKSLIGDLDAHHALAGDGSLDADRSGGQGHRQIVRQSLDAADLDLRRGSHLVLGDDRPRIPGRDASRDVEAGQLGFDDPGVPLVVHRRVAVSWRDVLQERERRQAILRPARGLESRPLAVRTEPAAGVGTFAHRRSQAGQLRRRDGGRRGADALIRRSRVATGAVSSGRSRRGEGDRNRRGAGHGGRQGDVGLGAAFVQAPAPRLQGDCLAAHLLGPLQPIRARGSVRGVGLRRGLEERRHRLRSQTLHRADDGRQGHVDCQQRAGNHHAQQEDTRAGSRDERRQGIRKGSADDAAVPRRVRRRRKQQLDQAQSGAEGHRTAEDRQLPVEAHALRSVDHPPANGHQRERQYSPPESDPRRDGVAPPVGQLALARQQKRDPGRDADDHQDQADDQARGVGGDRRAARFAPTSSGRARGSAR